MTFWCRIKKTKLISLSNQFKRCYFYIPGPCLINRTASHARTRVLENPTSFIRKTQIKFANNPRFFAAPVQAKVKTEEKDTGGPRLNKQITAEFIRLVSEEGHRVVSRSEALECARRLNLDLVEVQRNAKPPVCKLMDYHKEKYKQQTKEKDRAKSKSEVTLRKGDCKEVRFSGKTEQKDLQMKADTVKRLMERGYRVKCTAMGTEDQDLGGLLSCLSALIEDVSIVESGPRVEKRQAYVIVRHVKFGPSKKGSGKKASKGVGVMISETDTIPSSPPTVNTSMVNQTPIQFEEIEDHESGVEAEDEILSDEAAMHIPPSLEMLDKDINKKNPNWSVFDANDDLDSVFDFRNEGKVLKRSGDAQLNYARDTETVVDSTITEAILSFPSEALLRTENGNRTERRIKYPPARSMDGEGTNARASMRSEPQFLKQDRQQQFGLDVSPSTRETKRIGTDVSRYGDFKLPADDLPKQELRHSAPSSPAPGYGMFSAPKANGVPGKNGLPVEVNRYKKGNSFDSTRHPRSRGVSANPISPPSNTDGSGRPGVDKGGQGKWGIFSSESSNVMPSQNSESQSKVNR